MRNSSQWQSMVQEGFNGGNHHNDPKAIIQKMAFFYVHEINLSVLFLRQEEKLPIFLYQKMVGGEAKLKNTTFFPPNCKHTLRHSNSDNLCEPG